MARMSGKLAVFALGAFVAGCGSSSMSSMGSGGAGARAGGAQDIGLARAKVDAGIVPGPDDFPLEGLYAEHDLPVDGATCHEVFCVNAGSALSGAVLPPLSDGGVLRDGATDGGSPASWVHLGLSSDVDLSTFHRQALNAALIIDNSCSMTGEKLDAVKAAAETLVDHLGEGDLLTLVRFDDNSQVLVPPQAVTNRDVFKQKIRSIQAGGSTCLECGLKDGFSGVRKNLDASRSARVFVLTDEQPNVGATGAEAFMTLLSTNAKDAIGTTLFGVGFDFGQGQANQVMSVRGANFVYLGTPEKMRTVFDTDFDFLVTPIAYDLSLTMTPTQGVAFGAAYGIPGTAEGTISSTVATVFLSRTRGAIVVQLGSVAPGAALSHADLAFTTTDGVAKTAALDVVAPSGAAPSASGPGARKAVALTRYALGIRLACTRYQSQDKAGAVEAAQASAAFIGAEATALNDAALQHEAQFAQTLAALVAH